LTAIDRRANGFAADQNFVDDKSVLPEFDIDGDLPPGIHQATVDEIERRLARFVVSDRRISLFTRFKQLVAMIRSSGIVDRLVIGGSFVTSKAEPNDIDVVIILSSDVDFGALTPSQYTVADRDGWRRVLKTDALDVLTVRNGTTRMDLVLEFFQCRRENKQVGVVEVKL
jgi:hypothetical protein